MTMKKTTKLLMLSLSAMLLTAGFTTSAFAATGWVEENGEWVYKDNSGSRITNAFKKSGDYWFYLGDNGTMVTSDLIEHNEDYYYVNSNGVMMTNQWRFLEGEDTDDDGTDTWWYYFQSNGKAVKRSSSSTARFVTLPTSTGNAKFTFDEEGRCLFGWIGEDGERLTDEDAWKNGMYYCGDQTDGRQATGWKYLDAPDDDNSDREGDGYWFYFGTNGKKIKDTDKKTINGRKYRFDENGKAEYEWYANPGIASPTAGTPLNAQYYNTEEQCWLATGWFKMVPSEEIDPQAYDDDEPYWFYAKSNGELIHSQIKSINGHHYGFDTNGEMLHGLYKVSFDSDRRTILEVEEIEETGQIPDVTDDSFQVYYFGSSPKEGVMATGSVTINLDGEKYNYKFKKSGSDKGAGVCGIDDGSIYIEGKRLDADKEARYEAKEYEGEEYLVNTSGKIQKNKTNIKDNDDIYYCTDSRGVITYQGHEKYTK